jgi:hypothetical protein
MKKTSLEQNGGHKALIIDKLGQKKIYVCLRLQTIFFVCLMISEFFHPKNAQDLVQQRK